MWCVNCADSRCKLYTVWCWLLLLFSIFPLYRYALDESYCCCGRFTTMPCNSFGTVFYTTGLQIICIGIKSQNRKKRAIGRRLRPVRTVQWGSRAVVCQYRQTVSQPGGLIGWFSDDQNFPLQNVSNRGGFSHLSLKESQGRQEKQFLINPSNDIKLRWNVESNLTFKFTDTFLTVGGVFTLSVKLTFVFIHKNALSVVLYVCGRC